MSNKYQAEALGLSTENSDVLPCHLNHSVQGRVAPLAVMQPPLLRSDRLIPEVVTLLETGQETGLLWVPVKALLGQNAGRRAMVEAADMGNNAECSSEGFINLGICPVGRVTAFSPGQHSFVFAFQADGTGVSNKSLTHHRRRARPAAMAGVLER